MFIQKYHRFKTALYYYTVFKQLGPAIPLAILYDFFVNKKFQVYLGLNKKFQAYLGLMEL